MNDSWCSLTANFDRDRQWKYCEGCCWLCNCYIEVMRRTRYFVLVSRIKTTGGTGNGSECVFPFIYRGVSYSTCIYRIETSGSMRTFVQFCSTTSNLDRDGLWGFCLSNDSLDFISSMFMDSCLRLWIVLFSVHLQWDRIYRLYQWTSFSQVVFNNTEVCFQKTCNVVFMIKNFLF